MHCVRKPAGFAGIPQGGATSRVALAAYESGCEIPLETVGDTLNRDGRVAETNKPALTHGEKGGTDARPARVIILALRGRRTHAVCDPDCFFFVFFFNFL